MRAIIQRVKNASVEVNGKIISKIDSGLLVLAGIHNDDTEKDMSYIKNKVLGVRIFDDSDHVMNLSVQDIKGDILLVPQFTLYGDIRKGKRPSYSQAMHPDKATVFFDRFVNLCKSDYGSIKTGLFGADMKVSLINSGPVTIILDSTKIL